MTSPTDLLRALPSVERLVNYLPDSFTGNGHRALAVQISREVLASARQRILSGESPSELDDLVAEASRRIANLDRPPLRPVINATGVIIHTNLGRAPLSERAPRGAGRGQ